MEHNKNVIIFYSQVLLNKKLKIVNHILYNGDIKPIAQKLQILSADYFRVIFV